ncbi:MAG TPA: 30S ribosomal protein S4 [bacterium]|nr:30S ribosomal protein S4 [bacterium]HSA32275.1 30S ribosomal protein S4 [bacterium]
MAKYKESSCKICRKEGAKLFLKGERCHSEKCAYDRRPYGPGQHGKDRKRTTDYRVQLREKQKVKFMYGLLESQFRLFYDRAVKKKGATGENLLNLLERRLDNVVFRLGMASSRAQARQLISHRHFLVNGKITDIASFIVKQGDVIQIKEASRTTPVFKASLEYAGERVQVPTWLQLEKEQFKGSVLREPERTDISADIKENLIVELYSK